MNLRKSGYQVRDWLYLAMDRKQFCVCVCARTRACVRACVRVCVCDFLPAQFISMFTRQCILCNQITNRQSKHRNFISVITAIA
jgi:hypothetical protein